MARSYIRELERGAYSIAASLQHIHADVRRQMLGRDHHAVLGGHRRLRSGLRVELAESERCGEQEFGEQIEFHREDSVVQKRRRHCYRASHKCPEGYFGNCEIKIIYLKLTY